MKCRLNAKQITRWLFLIVFIDHAFDLISTKTSKKNPNNVQSFLEEEIKQFESGGYKCELKKVTIRSVNQIRWTKTEKEVILCAAKLLIENKKDGFLWTLLGSLLDKLHKDTDANFCYKQAIKLTGKITPFIKQWDYIGPFVIGKTEYDGDPLEAYGGIYNVSRFRLFKNRKYYSEFVPGGEITWLTFQQNHPDEFLKITPNINWNELVSALSSMGITEWQGWIVGEFTVNDKNQHITIQCLGVHTVYINGVPVTGDIYQRNQFFFGISLDRGIHSIYIKLRAKVAISMVCSFYTMSSTFEVLEPHFLPDIVDGHIFGRLIALPVANYHNSKWLKISKVRIMEQSKGSGLDINLLNQVYIAPGQILPVGLVLHSSAVLPCQDIKLSLKLTTSEGLKQFSMNIRCRKSKESFLFTFLDHDGSVQHAAAIYPLSDCVSTHCPVVLTLHGTTVPPQNQADSYKYMVKGQFLYGVDGAWLLAPTRHGAHNWEGPGALTAMKALESLSELVSQETWLKMKVDTNQVVFEGHSMGGHGALNLATHYPDRAVALISLAGWIKKEEYGDSNLFFRHDLAASHVDPSIKSLMEASITENDADRHVSNLEHVPVLLRTGKNDRTVPPFYLRRMYRLLKEIGAMVNYTELEGKEHWWWDTKETNDGGVVHDKQIRDFTAKVLQQNTEFCQEKSCGKTNQNKYKKPAKSSFTYTCINPAFGESSHGFQVIQQITPFKLSKIQGNIDEDRLVIDTLNVLRFSFKPKHSRLWNHLPKALEVDGTPVSYENSSFVVTFCKNNEKWEMCKDELLTSRGPSTYGPSRRIAENKFYIVLGSAGSKEISLLIQQFAVYLANLFFLTSDTQAMIIKDDELEDSQIEKTNLILLGSPEENLKTSSFLKRIPVKYRDSSFSISSCNFDQPRSGLLTLAPNGKESLALILMANSLKGFYDVISLATPTIPPMTRSPFSNLLPDYVVTGPDVGLKGPGGFSCIGFWGNNWEYRHDLSSCVC